MTPPRANARRWWRGARLAGTIDPLGGAGVAPAGGIATRAGGQAAAEAMAIRIAPFLVRRVLMLLGCGALLWGPTNALNMGMRYPEVGLIFIGCFLSTAAIAVAVVMARDERTMARLEIALLIVALLMIAAWGVTDLYVHNAPQNDEEVFIHNAATLLRQGIDPYTRGLSFGKADMLGQAFYTPLVGGGISDRLDYPAGSLLLVAALTGHTSVFQPAALINLAALMATTVLLFVMLPTTLRVLAVLAALGTPALLSLAASGETQVMMLPFLVVAAYRWHEIGRGGRLGRLGVTRALCLGLAASFQQLAWFAMPFLFIGIYLCRRDELQRRRTLLLLARYAALSLAAFLAVNLWFIVWHFDGWLTGVLAPLTQHAAPMGVGFITLTYYTHLSGSLTMYSVTSIIAVPALLAAYTLHFRRLAGATFVLAAVPLMLSSRSMTVYVVPLIPVWLVSVATSPPAVFSRVRRVLPRYTQRRRRLVTSVGFGVVAGVACVAALYPQPARIRLVSMLASSSAVNELRLDVSNHSGSTLRPSFMTATPDWFQSPYWTVIAGPAALGPHQSARYVLRAPDGWPGTSRHLAFRVEMLTANPYTVTTSPTEHPPPPTPTVKLPGVGAGGVLNPDTGGGNAGGANLGDDTVPGSGNGTGTRHDTGNSDTGNSDIGNKGGSAQGNTGR